MKRGRPPSPCPVSHDELRRLVAIDPRPSAIVVALGAHIKMVNRWLAEIGIEPKRRPPTPKGFARIATRPDGKRVSCTLYNIWHSMRLRCLTKNYRDYPYYGGRGIKICKEWDDYATFREWAISSGFRKGLTLDRANNDAGYGPHNCVWATMAEQCLNKRSTHIVEFRGERAPLYILAERLGLPKDIVRARVRMQGWSVERALTTPVNSAPRR